MNWNDYKFKWFMFWFFVVALLVVISGCTTVEPESTQPEEIRDLPEPTVECKLPADFEVIDPELECERVLIAETYWFDTPGIDPHTSFKSQLKVN